MELPLSPPLLAALAFAVGALLSFLVTRFALPPRAAATAALPAPTPPPAALPPPAPSHDAALFLLSLLQREGRLIDFAEEEVAPFSDAEVGAAARIVHEGVRKVLRQYLPVKAIRAEGEGAPVTVPAGFDAHQLRLTGNVTGTPPYQGALKHHGWIATAINLPDPPRATDLKVLAPAEVELP